MKARFKEWLDERRPSSRTTGVKVFSVIFCLAILGGVGYCSWWAWETITTPPVNPHANERNEAQVCYDDVDIHAVETHIENLESESEKAIAEYEWDGFALALDSSEMLDGGGRYPNSEAYCSALDEFITSITPDNTDNE